MDKRLVLTEEQAQAFETCDAAFNRCKALGVDFIFDTTYRDLVAINGKEVKSLLNDFYAKKQSDITPVADMPYIHTDALLYDPDCEIGIVVKFE